jgi:hypothetical protein
LPHLTLIFFHRILKYSGWVGFVELPLSNFCGYDNSIVAERVSGKHLSLLQVSMCL